MMPRRSCLLRAHVCAGIRSTTIKNPGARCAPAWSISRGPRPPVTIALLPPSRPASARPEQARSPNYPGPSRRCTLRQDAATRNLCPHAPLASPRQPVARGPAVGRPGRTQPHVRARPSPVRKSADPVIRPGCGHPRPGLHPARQYSAHAAAVPVRSLALPGSAVQTEVPSGLAASSADGSRRPPETLCCCPPQSLAGNQPACDASGSDVPTIRVPLTSRFHLA